MKPQATYNRRYFVAEGVTYCMAGKRLESKHASLYTRLRKAWQRYKARRGSFRPVTLEREKVVSFPPDIDIFTRGK